MIVIDASVMVSVFYDRDVRHLESRRWLRAYLRSGQLLIAPILLLSEVAGAITRRTGDVQSGRLAVRRLWHLPELQLIVIDTALGLRTTELAADLGLRGADAVYVALASDLQVPLITWDRQQRERGAQRGTTQEPQRPSCDDVSLTCR